MGDTLYWRDAYRGKDSDDLRTWSTKDNQIGQCSDNQVKNQYHFKFV